jgi:hypothetical protein
MRPDEILPDNVNEVTIEGLRVRKGSVAAFVASARVVVDEAAGTDAREAARRDIAELLPALDALRIFDVFEVRDARVKAVIEAVRRA